MNKYRKPFEGKISSVWLDKLDPLLKDFFINIKRLKLTYKSKDKRGYQCTNKSTIFPLFKDLIKPFTLLKDPNNIKGFIIGVEPYNNGEATGLPFQYKPFKYPPISILSDNQQRGYILEDSLKVNDLIPFFQIIDWDYLFKQGIFCINTSWTSELNKTCAFFDYWKDFSYKLVKLLCTDNQPILTIGSNNKDLYTDLTEHLIEAPNAFQKSYKKFNSFNPFEEFNRNLDNNLKFYKK